MVAAEREEPTGALHGIRVLDVAEPLGSYVSRILGDLGADVIKIEPPQGDLTRSVAPFLSRDHQRFSLSFLHSNVNKRSIILDLEQQQEQERFHDLTAHADIVVSTQSAATWARRGIDLQCLSQRFPRLIWTSLSPFGLSGPYSEYTGNNFIAEAMGGLMYIQGDDEQAPCVSPYEQGMHLASLHAAFGALMALWERRSSGLGQVVEVSVQEVVAHIYYIPVRYTYLRDILRRTGARNPQPANGYYRCKDGHVFICIFMPHHWDRLVELMADPILADPAFRDRDYRQANADLIETRLGQFAARFERWALTTAMQHRGLPVAPVSTVADLAANEHLAARDFFMDLGQPLWGRLRSVGPLFRASATPLRVRRPAPQPGEHQREVFAEKRSSLHSETTSHSAVPQRALPLAGIRVVDLSRVWAGPYGTRYLADAGAEVIKIESGKFPDGRRPHDPVFAEINRNKRFVTLNFQAPEGRDLLLRLVAMSDVVVENFSPRVMARYEIDYKHLCAVRPDLIMVSMPGFGHRGPHSQFTSYGGPLMAYTGMALLWGHAASAIDTHSKIAYPDYIAAGALGLAVTSALHHRAGTGQGQFIEIAQVEATAAFLEVAFLDYFANGTIAAPRGNRDPYCVPQGCYPCLGHDAWCAISCTTETQWQALAQILGGTTLVTDPRFATLAERWHQHDTLDGLISAWTRQRTPHQVMHLLQAVGIPAGAVQSGEDLWRDVHLRARRHFCTLTHLDWGSIEHPGQTVRLHGTPGHIRRPAGQLGEANADIFHGLLGLSQEEMARLMATGVIA